MKTTSLGISAMTSADPELEKLLSASHHVIKQKEQILKQTSLAIKLAGAWGKGRKQRSHAVLTDVPVRTTWPWDPVALQEQKRHVPWTGVTTAPLKWGFMCMFLGCWGVTGGGVIITLGASIWGGMCTPWGGEAWCGCCRGSRGCSCCCWNRLRMGCGGGGGGGGGCGCGGGINLGECV